MRRAALVGVLLGAVAFAAAAPASPEPAADFLATVPEAPSFPFLRLILSLAVIGGLVYAARPLLKRGLALHPGGAGGVEILGRAYLGPKAAVCLLKADGRKILVGVGPEGPRLLADLGAEPPAPPEDARAA